MNVNYTGRIGTTDGSVTKVNGSQDAEELQKALDVARQFEEFFVRMMVQSFRKAQLSDEGGMFGNSVGSSTYEQWFDQHMSEHLAKNSGIGIAASLIRTLRRHGELPMAEQTTDKPGVIHVA